MDEPGFFSKSRVLIVGLGLMGGSLALALQGKVAWLGGVDPSGESLELASQSNVFDALSKNMIDLLPLANVLILAAPVRQNIKIIQNLPDCENDLVVMDLSSTKRYVVAAMNSLPDCYDPVGGHPMCGSEKSSFRFARADLYLKAPFILTPLQRTGKKASAFARELIEQIGAVPIQLSPEKHDQITAESSHFPYVVAAVLCQSTHLESKPLISSGFKSTARIAGSSLIMMLDILLTNPENVLNSIVEFKSVLDQFEAALLNKDSEKLAQLIQNANEKYHALIE